MKWDGIRNKVINLLWLVGAALFGLACGGVFVAGVVTFRRAVETDTDLRTEFGDGAKVLIK